jgi:hypothetical protein
MGKQGFVLSQPNVQRMVTLLSATQMTIPEIAQRMGCSRGVVVAINRKFQVRKYAAAKSEWTLQKTF